MIVRNKIFLRRKRDFGDMFATVFTLLRRNFGVLFGSVLVVSGPFVILSAVVSSWMQTTMMRTARDLTQVFIQGNASQYFSDLIAQQLPWVIVLLLFTLLAYAFTRSTVASFFVVYESKLEGEEITVNEIAKKAYREGIKVFGGLLLFTLISVIPLAILFIPLALLATVGGGAGAILVVFVVFFGFLAFTPQMIYIFNFATWFVMVRDNLFVFSAIGRVFKNISGNFWWTWVLMVCTAFIVWILNLIVSVPFIIYSQVTAFTRMMPENMESSIIFILLAALTQLFTNFIVTIGDIMTGVSYYSFEEEKTGSGLTMRIDEIGKNEENPNYL